MNKSVPIQNWCYAAAIFAASLLTSVARAELTIEITKGVTDPIPIAVVPFGWSGVGALPYDVAEIVANDLKRSGMFEPMARKDMVDLPTRAQDVKLNDWRLLRTDFVVVGQLQPENNGQYTIQFEVLNALNGQHLLNYRQPATQSNLRAASHKVSDLIFEKLTGIRGAFSTRIAYVSVTGKMPKQNYQLIVADADGENPRVIAQSNEPLMSPTWSPDGTSIAYVSFENKVSSIYTQLLRTGERRRVSARAGINGAPAWSPDGRKLALTLSQKDGNLDIFVLELGNQQLTRITNDNAIDTESAWSVDGSSLYFMSDRSGSPQIYRVGAGGGNEQPRRITFDGSYNARPRVSPDGSQLAVITLDRGAYRIAVVDLKKGGMRVLSQGNEDESPSFAPNGAVLIYATQKGNRAMLATVSLDGGVQQRLGTDSGDIREPVWSPF
jgi:TolB protein